jgi:potassium efflux system protein
MAKNFISGLLLLIERPLRSGDTVQIGTQVGEVTHIGIRSLTVQTWDNMEVIIPNSDVISNAFTNWTHSDNVVRTVLMIGARYDADPHLVKRVISRVLENHTDVLSDPEWLVLFWEFGESAVTFRVQYFTDFFKSNILEVRNEVLFGVWDGFKEAGIGIPYPQRDLHIKEWPSRLSVLGNEPAPVDPPLLHKGSVRGSAPSPARVSAPSQDSHR